MLIYVLAFIGGVLTILSPCILPVLPFVFARHLVLGPTKDGKPVRFVVTLDGTPPGEDHGSDTDANGAGTVEGHRLYQHIRKKGAVEDRTFQIEFLDPGVQAFAFTFG
jgi:thioredoxin family protein